MPSFHPQYIYSTSSSANSFQIVADGQGGSYVVSAGGGGGYGGNGGNGGGYSAALPSPLPPRTNLDWLDDEVEAVCKLARQAA